MRSEITRSELIDNDRRALLASAAMGLAARPSVPNGSQLRVVISA